MADRTPLPAPRAQAFPTAGEMLRDLEAGRTTSRVLLDELLARVERDPHNAVVSVDVENARVAADAADAARAAGERVGALHGLPMTVKDCFETEGLRTSCGVPDLADHVPAADATAVARLRQAGAVIFGKTNTPTWASDWQTTNPVFGRTTNPHDPTRTPGGSSGGSAAAVAAGLTPLELGSDIGGSIRVPAHWSGVCGHKPSHGLVPQRGHLPGSPGDLADADLNTVGPLARCVADLARALSVLAGPAADRARAWRVELPPPRATDLAGFRVGTWLDEPAGQVDGEVAGVIRTALDALSDAGARIEERHPQVSYAEAVDVYTQLLMPLNTRVHGPEEDAGLEAVVAALQDDPDDRTARSLRAHLVLHRDWLRLNEARERIRVRWAQFFEDYDVLVCPVNLTAAIPHDDRPFFERTVEVDGRPRPYAEQIGWPGLITMALLPSTVIPLGRTPEGLPVGAQFVGPFLEDQTSLAFAAAAEAVLGVGAPPPSPPTGGSIAAVSR